MPLNTTSGNNILKKYRQNRNIFIETGTADGDGIQFALDAGFKEIYSIELSENLHNKALDRFKDYNNVHLILGSSEIELPKLLSQMSSSFVLWLDAHWSGGVYIGELMNVYLPKELNSILNFSSKFDKSLVLVDDMNHYIQDTNFVKTIEDLVIKLNPNYKITYVELAHSTILVAKK
jgi:hypothetical protein